MSHRPCLVILAALLLTQAGVCLAGKFNAVVEIGQLAPDWAGLEGIDGKQHSLTDYKQAKVVVLVFTCNHCPVATAYQERLAAVHSDYRERGVQVVAISVSKLDADLLPAMKKRAEAAGFEFPYLHDASQQSGRVYGASVTPHVFVLDEQRTIAYMGRIDDQQDPAKVKKQYLRDALDALLAGRPPKVKESFQQGCEIQYE